MNSFEELRIHLCWLGIFPIIQSESNPKAKYIITIAIRCAFVVIYIQHIFATVWYIVFEAQTPKEHSESLFIALSTLLLFSWYSVLITQTEKYAAILDELNSIIEKRIIDPTVNLIYENTNINVEWMTKKGFFVFRTIVLLYIIVPIMLSLFNYIKTEGSNESYLQNLPASYPFDWKTPRGYVACVFIQSLSAVAAVELYTIVLVLTIGVCMLISNFGSDIKEKLRHFNRILIISENNEFPPKDRILLVKKLREIIEFYSKAMEFAHHFSDVNSAIIVICPLFTIAVFGSLILQVTLLTKTGDILGIVQIAIGVIMSMFPFFLFCHFGGKITEQFEDIGNAIYQLEWYKLPLDMQKDLGVMIALAQKQIFIRGYGDTRTTHSAFLKIVKNKFYFFILSRKL